MGATNFGAFTPAANFAIMQMIAQMGFATTGKIFYLDPLNGNDNNNGQSPTFQGGGVGPVASLATGYALLTSGNNDVLVLIGNGLTTASARLSKAFTWSKSAAHFVGIAAPTRLSPQARVAPTLGATAFANMFILSGNGCLFANITFFQGFTTGTTNQICFTISGKNNCFRNCAFQGMGDTQSANDAGSRSLLIQSGENSFINCQIGIDTIKSTALNASVEFQSGAARNFFEDCVFPRLGSATTSGITLLAAAADAIDRVTVFKHCTFSNASTFSGGAAPTGFSKLAASAGGIFLFQQCTIVGSGVLGYDATSDPQCFVLGPVPTGTTSSIAVAE